MGMRDTVDASWALQAWVSATVVNGCGRFRNLLRAAAVPGNAAAGTCPIGHRRHAGWPVPARSKECMR